jgi:putative transposase
MDQRECRQQVYDHRLRELVRRTGDTSIATSGLLSRVRALVDVRFSNSMIETWWRTIKHQWLFLHRLETVSAVRRHVAFYVYEYNATIPHVAFCGQTPDEVYFARGDQVPAELEAGRRVAQARRLAVNRALSCSACLQQYVAA